MSGLTRDELGFVRTKGFGQIDADELRKILDPGRDETLYHTSVRKGTKQTRPVSGGRIEVKPGDTFSVGPTITKAASEGLPLALRREAEGLARAGFGALDPPVKTQWGWALRMAGLVLPDGSRTDALVLLPSNYPITSPIGFYLRDGASSGQLDLGHLFSGRAYHGAQTLPGWRWFCGIADNWQPNRHNLISYVSMVFSFFNEEKP